MANTYITPSNIARAGLATLYDNLVLAGLVHRDFDGDFAGKQGDTITVRTPPTFEAKLFNRASGIEIQNITEGSFPVKLDKIVDVSFAVTTEELTLDIDTFASRILNPAMDAIVQYVDTTLAESLVDIAKGEGGGGTVAMNTKFNDAVIGAREVLTRNKLPLSNRYAVLSPEATSVGLSDELFVQADESGSTSALRDASLGRAFGFETYETGTLGYGAGDKGASDGVAFHRDALTLVTRTLQTPLGVAPSQVAVESYKGVGLRVVQAYDVTKKQDVVSVDFLYGVTPLRPEAAVALDFGQGS